MTLVLTGVLAARAQADITYISNGEVPDFPQVWNPLPSPPANNPGATQQMKAICEAATAADEMWYWDQHGYRGLAAITDPNNPNDNWRADAQNLEFLLAKYIYGKDPITKNPSNLGAGTTLAALSTYIKKQGMYAGQQAKGAQGLVVDYYQAGNSTYTNWVNTINAGTVNMAGMSWRTNAGENIALHSMVSLGVDSNAGVFVVSHGWGDHPANMAPFKLPPYAANETPYINQYPMTVTNDKRVRIPNPGDGSVDIFAGAKYGAADFMSMGDFYAIHPKAKARVQMKAKQGTGFDLTYTSDVSNDTFEPIYQYIQEVETPITSVTAPPGWTAVPWSYLNTPDVTRLPLASAPPPYENDPIDPVDPVTLQGILYYTTSEPVMPGNDLDGFSFEGSQAFSSQAEDSMSIVSDGRSTFVDAMTTGLTSEVIYPTLVPEPGTATLFVLAATVLLARRGRRRPVDDAVMS
jgi:hypothetical protein